MTSSETSRFNIAHRPIKNVGWPPIAGFLLSRPIFVPVEDGDPGYGEGRGRLQADPAEGGKGAPGTRRGRRASVFHRPRPEGAGLLQEGLKLVEGDAWPQWAFAMTWPTLAARDLAWAWALAIISTAVSLVMKPDSRATLLAFWAAMLSSVVTVSGVT